MKTRFRKSFERDLRKIKDRRVLHRVRAIIEAVERSEDLASVSSLRKMSGTSGFYRIRAGDYRIGVVVEDEAMEFVRVLHRRDIYRYFP